MLNLLTDVAGLTVGHAHDDALLSGVTAIVFEEPAVASVVVPGGAAAGRDLGCLVPDAAVQEIDAIVLSGSVAEVPSALLEQLKVGGRLVAVVGELPMMRARLFTRVGDAAWSDIDLFDTVAPRLEGFEEAPRFHF